MCVIPILSKFCAYTSGLHTDVMIASGAVKSNIGHLEGASGIAGVIKTIMVLEKGVIPPNANFERLNPKIDAHSLHLKACRT